MNTHKYLIAPVLLVLATLLSGCFGSAGGQVEYVDVPSPIYADQTYSKMGHHNAHAGALESGQAACVHGRGVMQRGTLICPGH